MIHTLFDHINRSAFRRIAGLSTAFALWAMITGCETQTSSKSPNFAASGAPGMQSTASNSLVLHPGDNIKVTFPGAPNMDAQTSIRLDGKISLPMIGELTAAGMTPTELEQELLRVAGPQLVVKEVNVSVVSSAFEIYVSGAVLRPGKLVEDRVLTPLEAVMDAGVDYQRANLKSVQIIRKMENGQTENFKVNLQKALKGEGSEPFPLKPFDIIYVPERFNWF